MSNIFINSNKRLFCLSDDIDNESIGNMCFYLLQLIQEDDEKDKKEKKLYKRTNQNLCKFIWWISL